MAGVWSGSVDSAVQYMVGVWNDSTVQYSTFGTWTLPLCSLLSKCHQFLQL